MEENNINNEQNLNNKSEKEEELKFHEEDKKVNKYSKKMIIGIIFGVISVLINLYSCYTDSKMYNDEHFDEYMSQAVSSGISEDIEFDTDYYSLFEEKYSSPADTIVNVVGIASFIAAIVFCAMSVKEIKKQNLKGRGLAIFGIFIPIIGYLLATIISMVVMLPKMLPALISEMNCMPYTTEDCTLDSDGKNYTCINAGGESISCNRYVLEAISKEAGVDDSKNQTAITIASFPMEDDGEYYAKKDYIVKNNFRDLCTQNNGTDCDINDEYTDETHTTLKDFTREFTYNNVKYTIKHETTTDAELTENADLNSGKYSITINDTTIISSEYNYIYMIDNYIVFGLDSAEETFYIFNEKGELLLTVNNVVQYFTLKDETEERLLNKNTTYAIKDKVIYYLAKNENKYELRSIDLTKDKIEENTIEEVSISVPEEN